MKNNQKNFSMPLTKLTAMIVAFTIAVPALPQDMAPTPSNNDDSCNTAISAGVGALLGGLLGGKKHRAVGAVIGAGLGGLTCIAINYHSKQVKTAQQVNEAFMVKNSGQLPQQPIVTSYKTMFTPTDRIQPGGATVLNSYMEVVQGADNSTPVIEQEIAMFMPDGKEVKRTRKLANSSGSTGAFQTSSTIKLPEGVPQGIYPLQTALYLNGQPVTQSNVRLQVVEVKGERIIALLSE